MIEPQPAQRNSIGQQHGLTRLTTALEEIERGQRVQQSRDEQAQAQLTSQAHALAQTQSWLRMVLSGVGLLVMLALGLLGVGGWQVWHPPHLGWMQAFSAVDTTLAQS